MRVAVPLDRAYRLINHGPATLITSAHAGRANVMAAQWVMPVDFEPPLLAVVIDGATFTRTLVDASRALVVNVPTRAQLDLVATAGSASGADVDKLAALAVPTSPAARVAAPLVDGCAAWLECVLRDERDVEGRHDLFLAEVVAAWADDASWRGDRWDFPDDDHRTLHHQGGGVFFLTGAVARGRRLL